MFKKYQMKFTRQIKLDGKDRTELFGKRRSIRLPIQRKGRWFWVLKVKLKKYKNNGVIMYKNDKRKIVKGKSSDDE